MIVFSHANSFAASTYGVLFNSLKARGFTVKAIEKFGHDASYPVTETGPRWCSSSLTSRRGKLTKRVSPCFWSAIPLAALSA